MISDYLHHFKPSPHGREGLALLDNITIAVIRLDSEYQLITLQQPCHSSTLTLDYSLTD